MGLSKYSFFLKAVIGDDPLDTAPADGEVGLAELLGDDIGGRVGIQEAVAQDLADRLVGTPIIGFGAGLLRLEGGEATALEGIEDLIIALTAIAILLGDGGDVGFQTFAFDQHEEAVGQLVGGFNGEGAGRAGELVSLGIKLQ